MLCNIKWGYQGSPRPLAALHWCRGKVFYAQQVLQIQTQLTKSEFFFQKKENINLCKFRPFTKHDLSNSIYIQIYHLKFYCQTSSYYCVALHLFILVFCRAVHVKHQGQNRQSAFPTLILSSPRVKERISIHQVFIRNPSPFTMLFHD